MPLKHLLLLVTTVVKGTLSQAQTTLDDLALVGDIDNTLPATSGDIFSSDDAIIHFDLITNTATKSNDLGTLDGVGIDGYHQTGDGCGDSVYSVDTTTLISSVAMRSTDVFTSAGVKVLDANTAGIPDGVNIDAVSRDPDNCDLILSIDIAALLSGIAFKPDDIIRWNSSNGFSLIHRTNYGANIDAIHYLNTTNWLVSLDTGKSLPNVNGVDEQIFEITNSTQLLSVDLINFDNSWDAADINAIWAQPKPFIEFMFADGFE